MAERFANVPAGPHRMVLIREELHKRLRTRLGQMAAQESLHDELAELSLDEQLRLFHGPFDPQDEREARSLAQAYVNDRYAAAFEAVERDDWLSIDRIGQRLLGRRSLEPLEWLYLKIAVTGLADAQAQYVMVDEVQDYTAAQLAVLARYYAALASCCWATRTRPSRRIWRRSSRRGPCSSASMARWRSASST